jgi:hypothetical protein
VALPFRPAAFLAAVSLQVVEHIWDPITYLRELARCTRGPIIMSTPNRPVHSPSLQPHQRPENPFHTREFDAEELTELIDEALPARLPEITGLNHGPRIRGWEAVHGSLPRALNHHDNEIRGRALLFATSIADDDFLVGTDAQSAHDLIVIV